MTERTTVRLPDDLLRQAKRKALAEGRTLTSLIEEGLRIVVARRGAVAGGRGRPRISRAAGGLRPGIDLDRTASLQEADDLDYAARMTGRE